MFENTEFISFMQIDFSTPFLKSLCLCGDDNKKEDNDKCIPSPVCCSRLVMEIKTHLINFLIINGFAIDDEEVEYWNYNFASQNCNFYLIGKNSKAGWPLGQPRPGVAPGRPGATRVIPRDDRKLKLKLLLSTLRYWKNSKSVLEHILGASRPIYDPTRLGPIPRGPLGPAGWIFSHFWHLIYAQAPSEPCVSTRQVTLSASSN